MRCALSRRNGGQKRTQHVRALRLNSLIAKYFACATPFTSEGMSSCQANCAREPQGKHFFSGKRWHRSNWRSGDNLFGRALSTLQRRGWIIAVSDRAGGLLTTQEMATARASGMLNGREAEALDRLTRSVVDLGR